MAWNNYRKGKRRKEDIQHFEFKLEDNIFALHHDLIGGIYQPGGYQQFQITDPKLRVISKASVRDRLVHQAIYQILYPPYDATFISDSYACRKNMGTHRAFHELADHARQVSRNYTQPCWALKCDIKKFFDSVDHQILKLMLRERIGDTRMFHLLGQIIDSFAVLPGKGMPLGNLTSQLFANIYMDPFDKFVKHKLNALHYLRYADDFILLSQNPEELMGYFVEISRFLRERLALNVHPNKITFRKLSWGLDFVGYVVRPHHNVPRNKTVRRIKRAVNRSDLDQLEKTLPSYIGHLSHARSGVTIRELISLKERLVNNKESASSAGRKDQVASLL
ncbi:MAG: reverse transcriptase/maturase family protein [Patescibacteria group bacterium]|mgnify:CR=1 FL=1